MNNIIEVKNENGELLVSARNLHKGLEISERFNSWFDRMLKYGFEKDIDFTSVKTFTLVHNGAKKEIDEYILKLDCAKEIAMIQRSEKGKQIRKYFIECEKQLKELTQDSFMIADPIERAKRWIQEQEEKKVIEQQLIQTKNTLDIVVTNNITFDMFNKELNKLINIASNTIKMDIGKTYSTFYTFINNKLSINLTSRQNNKIKKLNEEHFKKKGKYYSDSTLKTKASKLSCIKENEYEQVLSIAKSFIVDNGGDITNYNKLVVL